MDPKLTFSAATIQIVLHIYSYTLYLKIFNQLIDYAVFEYNGWFEVESKMGIFAIAHDSYLALYRHRNKLKRFSHRCWDWLISRSCYLNTRAVENVRRMTYDVFPNYERSGRRHPCSWDNCPWDLQRRDRLRAKLQKTCCMAHASMTHVLQNDTHAWVWYRAYALVDKLSIHVSHCIPTLLLGFMFALQKPYWPPCTECSCYSILKKLDESFHSVKLTILLSWKLIFLSVSHQD